MADVNDRALNIGPQPIRYFLIGTGLLLLMGSGIRFYRLIRTHTENYFFAPNLLFALLSLWIAWKVFKVGLENSAITRKGTISLIRSGSVLMMIWGYRFYLLITAQPKVGAPEGGLDLSLGLSIFYHVLGGLVMLLGLYISRSVNTEMT